MNVTAIHPAMLEEIFRRRNLKLVTIDCPYDHLQDRDIRELFGRVVALKIRGYRKEYPYGVLALDDADYFGTHLLLCEQTMGGLKPLMGFKSVPHDRCAIFHRDFPMHHLLHNVASPAHHRSVEKMMQDALARGQPMAYNGSWTMEPDLRKDDELRKVAWALTAVMLVKFYEERGNPLVLSGAVVRFKVPELKLFLGFDFMRNEQGDVLEPVECDFVFNEKVAFMWIQKFSAHARKWASGFNSIWEDRLTIGPPGVTAKSKVAA